VGELSLVELGKRLSGKLVGVGPNIGDLREGFSGGRLHAGRGDAARAGVHVLHGAAPGQHRLPEYQSRAREALRNRDASPESAFQDTLRLALAQSHPRARRITTRDFERMDLALHGFYRDRFADAGDFTFYFVADWRPDSLRPRGGALAGRAPRTGSQGELGATWDDVPARGDPQDGEEGGGAQGPHAAGVHRRAPSTGLEARP
jgi:zinc protease